MRRKAKVLYLLHNHPSLYPGGPETYALELHEAMARSAEFEPILAARIGSEGEEQRGHRPGTPFSPLNGNPDQYLVLMEKGAFDFFNLTFGDKSLYTRGFADFLRFHNPDLVHFQHSIFLGCELISLVRNVLPRVPIVYTLHDYMPICHRDGKLVRTRSEALCLEASPRRCHECFPQIPEEDFFLRKRFIQTHFDKVDLFLAPSHFLLERYVDWGVPRKKIRFEDYGRPPVPVVPEGDEDRPRTRLGFFGELSPYKGTEVLLEAVKLLQNEQADVHLWLHGANLWKYPDDYRKRVQDLLDETQTSVTFTVLHWTDELGDSFGGLKTSPDRQSLQDLMTAVDWVVVPSRWWEGSPLVIQEAFRYRRPVICTGIGAMAEKVTDGVNGLHFPFNDSRGLAGVIRRAVTTPGLWKELEMGIPAVYSMAEHVESLTSLYRERLDRTRRSEASALRG